MKSIKKIFVAIILLMAMLTFSACSDDALPDENNPVDTGDNNSDNPGDNGSTDDNNDDLMEDSALIEIFETKLYNNAIDLIARYVGGYGLDLDLDSHDINDERGKYAEVKNIKDIAELKATYEAVFSRGLLDKYVYPGFFEREPPLFAEYDGKLYYDTDAAGGMSSEPDFTRAKVINKSADTFEIEMPMANGDIFTYKIVQQNGNWVLDSFYVFDLQN